jgi:hypothetical protein
MLAPEKNSRQIAMNDISEIFYLGRPVPYPEKECVAAGLLALGSSRLARLPGSLQWHELAGRSPITVTGAAPDWGTFIPATGFPFDSMMETADFFIIDSERFSVKHVNASKQINENYSR